MPKISKTNMERVLVENFISLQKVLTNLSIKFDNLSDQISKLLELFEISAKSLAEKDIDLGGKKEKEILERLNSIQEQNKTIAEGLTGLYDKFSPQNLQQQGPPDYETSDFSQRKFKQLPRY